MASRNGLQNERSRQVDAQRCEKPSKNVRLEQKTNVTMPMQQTNVIKRMLPKCRVILGRVLHTRCISRFHSLSQPETGRLLNRQEAAFHSIDGYLADVFQIER